MLSPVGGKKERKLSEHFVDTHSDEQISYGNDSTTSNRPFDSIYEEHHDTSTKKQAIVGSKDHIFTDSLNVTRRTSPSNNKGQQDSNITSAKQTTEDNQRLTDKIRDVSQNELHHPKSTLNSHHQLDGSNLRTVSLPSPGHGAVTTVKLLKGTTDVTAIDLSQQVSPVINKTIKRIKTPLSTSSNLFDESRKNTNNDAWLDTIGDGVASILESVSSEGYTKSSVSCNKDVTIITKGLLDEFTTVQSPSSKVVDVPDIPSVPKVHSEVKKTSSSSALFDKNSKVDNKDVDRAPTSILSTLSFSKRNNPDCDRDRKELAFDKPGKVLTCSLLLFYFLYLYRSHHSFSCSRYRDTRCPAEKANRNVWEWCH
jgi:hypothetical protein